MNPTSRRHLALVLAALLFALPLLFALSASIKTPSEIYNALALPQSIYVGNYSEALTTLGRPLLNSVVITFPSVVLSVFVGCLAAFPLSMLPVKLGRPVYLFLLIGMFVPFQIAQIPVFFTIRALHLYDTVFALWIVHAAYGVPFCTFFMRNYFITVPRSLFEAAQIDGCGPAAYFFRILLPASITGLAALGIVQARGIWNDLLFALTLTHSNEAEPVTMQLYSMIGAHQTDPGLLMASTVITTIPVIVVFLSFQNAFTRGLLGGTGK
jgi:glucose/mannose transport system permease protein